MKNIEKYIYVPMIRKYATGNYLKEPKNLEFLKS